MNMLLCATSTFPTWRNRRLLSVQASVLQYYMYLICIHVFINLQMIIFCLKSFQLLQANIDNDNNNSLRHKNSSVPVLCLCPASVPVHNRGAEWRRRKDPRCQRGWCLEGVLWGDGSGDSGRVCHEIWSRVHLPGHDVSPTSITLNVWLFKLIRRDVTLLTNTLKCSLLFVSIHECREQVNSINV